MYFKGPQVELSILRYISVSEGCFNVKKHTLMKYAGTQMGNISRVFKKPSKHEVFKVSMQEGKMDDNKGEL